MRTIHEWLSEYGESHQNSTNKLIHWICVPAIMFSIFGLLTSIPSDYLPLQPYLNWASIALLAVLLFYLRLSLPIFLGFIPVALLLWYGNQAIQSANFMDLWKFSLIVFITAWIGQFYGHKVEGKKPSFFKDLQFLLIGPAWLMSFILNKFNISY